jgi:hypothetical protein
VIVKTASVEMEPQENVIVSSTVNSIWQPICVHPKALVTHDKKNYFNFHYFANEDFNLRVEILRSKVLRSTRE